MDEFLKFWNYALLTVPSGAEITIGKVIMVFGLLLLAYGVSRVAGYLLGRRLAAASMRPDAVHTLKRVTVFVVLVLIVLAVLGLLGIPLTAFAFATGAIAIGIGFGAQNIINNFISGWILMAERPIRINDFVELDDKFGVVEYIGTRSTRIRRTDGVHLLVPNSHLLERTVVNWTLIDALIRTTVKVGVAYGSPVEKVAELILFAVTENKDVHKEPAPQVIFDDFGDSALTFEAYFWCDANGEKALRRIRSDLRFRITRLFADNDIVIAFPQRDVHLDINAPVKVRMLNAESP